MPVFQLSNQPPKKTRSASRSAFPSWHQHPLYGDWRWRALRMAMIAAHGEVCQGENHDPRKPRQGPVELDHKLPLATHPELALDPNNVELLCLSCHRTKTQETKKQIMRQDELLHQAYREGRITIDELNRKLKALWADG